MRRSGLLVPLFSCPSMSSWGIGDIGDVANVTEWLAGAGQSILQLLPLNEMASGQQSPYSAMSAMAIDPIFINVNGVPEVSALGGEDSLSAADQKRLFWARRSPRVDYRTVRHLKRSVMEAAFERFLRFEWYRDSERALELRAFLDAEAWWLDNYALFRAIHDRESNRAWTEWPEALKKRNPNALEAARKELEREVLRYQYLQWIADTQWREARTIARAAGVRLFGNLPFMVDGDSADVWLHQDDFYLDVSVGVPPDAFSATGQDWGMPAYRWDTIASKDFSWLRERARRSAALYDGYRVDHLVGFYRTYGRPKRGAPFFNPPDEAAQVTLGERVLNLMREPGSDIIAEDLGIVPDFIRRSLSRLGVPGFRVFRWERLWHQEDQPFCDPSTYPPSSVAVSGTHDTEPLRIWWEQLSAEDRARVAALPSVRNAAADGNPTNRSFDAGVRDALLEALFAAGSDLVLLPIQDVFGWSDRINEPATVKPDNWSFRLPWPSDQLDDIPEARERQATLRAWAHEYSRV